MPKRIDVDVQRRLIADAAISVISQTGLQGAGLREVAKAAKVTTGAITHYFDSKDAVLEAALKEIVGRTLDRIEAGRGDLDRWTVSHFIDRVYGHLPIDAESRGEWRVWLAFWGRALTDERLRMVHQHYYSAFVDHSIGSLERLEVDGAPPSRDELGRIADAMIAAVDGIGIRATLEPRSWPAARQRGTLEQLLRPLLSCFADRPVSGHCHGR